MPTIIRLPNIIDKNSIKPMKKAEPKKTNKKTKKKVKKYNYINDVFKEGALKNKGGIYCFTPFESLDDDDKGLFKVGLSSNIAYRAEQGYTYFPLGVYWVAFLTDLNTKAYTLNSVEKFIFQKLVDKGAKRIYTETREKNRNEEGLGASEWFYTDIATIQHVFKIAVKEYKNCKAYFDYNMREIKNQSTERKDKAENENHYTGKIIYFV